MDAGPDTPGQERPAYALGRLTSVDAQTGSALLTFSATGTNPGEISGSVRRRVLRGLSNVHCCVGTGGCCELQPYERPRVSCHELDPLEYAEAVIALRGGLRERGDRILRDCHGGRLSAQGY